MYKLVFATLVAFFGVLHFFGDKAPDADVARSETLGDDAPSRFSFAALIEPATASAINAAANDTRFISESDAIDAAIAAGKEWRSKPKAAAPADIQLASAEATAPVPAAETWYVTGSRVNLRSGPSTSDGVVTQVVLGQSAEVLEATNDWMQIRTDRGQIGWIFGQFLDTERPG